MKESVLGIDVNARFWSHVIVSVRIVEKGN